ncbi:DNA cytosine methyltransferase [Paenibacillus larvae]
MKKLSLFSGIGGIDLAAKWAGIETVAFCEKEHFPQKVLRRHWPNTPIYDDVCTLTREVLERDGIIGTGRTIDLISAGYPCQGESYAGKRKGQADDRWLWPEVTRILDELSPSWFLGENVSGHITMGLDQVFTDLETLNYTAMAFHIPALAVDGDHERYRVLLQQRVRTTKK